MLNSLLIDIKINTMNDLFSIQNRDYQTEKRCLFLELGGCGTMVHHQICNEHSVNFFGLYYSLNDFTDGTGYHRTRIETFYANSDTSFEIPLFRSATNAVLSEAVLQYSEHLSRNCPGGRSFNYKKLASIILPLVGLTPYSTECFKVSGWLADETSAVYLFEPNITKVVWSKYIPVLHKILFKHTYPSITQYTKESAVGERRIENMILKHDDENIKFVMTNNKMVLKRTNKVNCVKTPIVIAGVTLKTISKIAATSNISKITDCSKANVFY